MPLIGIGVFLPSCPQESSYQVSSHQVGRVESAMTAVIHTDRFTHKHTSLFIRLTDINFQFCVLYHCQFVHKYIVHTVVFYYCQFIQSSVEYCFIVYVQISTVEYCFTVYSHIFHCGVLFHSLFIVISLQRIITLFIHSQCTVEYGFIV